MAAPLPPAGVKPPAEALACVPGLERGAAPRLIEPLEGGTVNDSWRVATDAGDFVLRIDGPAWRRPGVDRAREFLLHGLAAAAGLAPAIIRHAPEQGALVCEYLAGRDWSPASFEDSGALARLGARLAQLHALPAPALPRFDPLATWQAYLDQAGAGARAGADARWPGLAADAALLARAPPAIVHGDLAHGNLREAGALRLLDWEYAQVADPAWDVGCVLSYYPAARARRGPLLAAAGLAGADAAGRVAAARRCHDALAWAWQQARQAGAGARAPRSAN